jgi:hypothetical protein
MQCTTQRAEAQMPSLSAEKAETRDEVLINKKSFQEKLERTEHLLLTPYCNSMLPIENFVSSHTQTVATAGRISDTSTHCVG